MCFVIIYFPLDDVINFDMSVFQRDQKTLNLNLNFKVKNLNFLRTKRTLKMKSKAVFIIFKGLSLKPMKPTFLEGGSQCLMFHMYNK